MTYGNNYVTFLPSLIVESVCRLPVTGAGTGNLNLYMNLHSVDYLDRACISPEREGKKSLLINIGDYSS